jgi:hypothetical protein
MGYPGKAYRVFCSETGAGFALLGGGWCRDVECAAGADRWQSIDKRVVPPRAQWILGNMGYCVI